MNALDFRGRAAIITGGAAGIGLAVARRLAASGATIALWDRDAGALATAKRGLPDTTRTNVIDVADAGSAQRVRGTLVRVRLIAPRVRARLRI